MSERTHPRVSIIIPAYNEEESLPILFEELAKLIECRPDYEVILVDDGSTDRTYQKALECQKKYSFAKVARHRRNFGKTRALLSGLDQAEGEIIVLLDADLQYMPEDVPKLVAAIDNGSDVVTGWKQGKYEKRLVSSIYNRLSRRIFKIPIHDQNAVKALRRGVLDDLPLRKDWHRYIIALAVDRGYTVTEVKVTLHPRRFGSPKYAGPKRILIGGLDMIAVKFQLSFMRKPLLLFGTTGVILLVAGLVVGLIALYLRFALDRGFRPVLYLVILLVLAGLSLFALGFLAEAIATVNDKISRLQKRLPKE